jgi:hypothetical protein
MTIDKMRSVIITQMKHMELPADVIKHSLDLLPHVKRWKRIEN